MNDWLGGRRCSFSIVSASVLLLRLPIYLPIYLPYIPAYLPIYLSICPAPPSRGAALADKICSDLSPTRSVDCGGSSFFLLFLSFFPLSIGRTRGEGVVTTSIPFFCWGGFRALVVVVCPFFRSLTPPAARKYVCGILVYLLSPPRGVKESRSEEGKKGLSTDIYQHSLGLPCSQSKLVLFGSRNSLFFPPGTERSESSLITVAIGE